MLLWGVVLAEGDKVLLLTQPFPTTINAAAPDPSNLWSPSLRRKSPLPTNTAWLNFVLNHGSAPEYLHPYLIQIKDGSVSICFPSRSAQPAFILQPFVPNLTICSGNPSSATHFVTAFDDLSVTLELPGQVTVPLVRGCPYVTFIFDKDDTPRFSTIHAVLSLVSNSTCTKHKVSMNNGQTWLIYSSDRLDLTPNLGLSGRFTGVVRVALLTGGDAAEAILDRFNSVYPVQGHADISIPFQVKYEWKKNHSGELLMLSLPTHRDVMFFPGGEHLHPELSYRGIDGELQAVVGDSWVLKESSLALGWHSLRGIADERRQREIKAMLRRDVAALMPITSDSTYFHGKALAKVARMAIIADEVGSLDVLKKTRDFLREAMTPWLEGKFPGNAFLYDEKWGGLISRNGSQNSQADFGLGVYNDHHYHMGYFCYSGAVLAKLDPAWGNTYRSHLYTIAGDYMSLHHHHAPALFPRLRNFDLWVLHSWAGGLTEFADGRNQESTSEAVNAYYAASLLGLAYKDSHLVNAGLTLAALEIRAARTLWHVPSNSTLYDKEFVSDNRVLGVLWANKRDSALWFAGPERKECRVGIQLLPILPITEVLFQDVEFVQELVQWAWPSLSSPNVTDGWKGFVYALQALYAPEEAFRNVIALREHDDGNSASNLLWWIFSRESRS